MVRRGGGYGGQSDRLVDLRVDDHPAPITELARLLELHRLYFERPSEADLVPIDADLAADLAARLGRLGGEAIEPLETARLWEALERWAGRENLEERMVRPGFLDRTVLRILRGQTEG